MPMSAALMLLRRAGPILGAAADDAIKQRARTSYAGTRYSAADITAADDADYIRARVAAHALFNDA